MNAVDSLKAPGFKPLNLNMIFWFPNLLFKFKLYRYTAADSRPRADTPGGCPAAGAVVWADAEASTQPSPLPPPQPQRPQQQPQVVSAMRCLPEEDRRRLVGLFPRELRSCPST